MKQVRVKKSNGVGNRNYVRGRAREYGVKRKLLAMGALWVVRSYASKGLFDLTAVFPDHVRLIQVKKSYINPREKAQLEDFAMKVTHPSIFVELWISNNRRYRVVRLRGGSH
ncbi:MAG: hypothetical protein QW767_02795 [Thermoprotei archaeon]